MTVVLEKEITLPANQKETDKNKRPSLMVYRKKQKKRAKPKAKASKDLWNEKIDEVQLLEMIETLKLKMSQLVKEKGLGHQSVVEISQQLDEYIVQFQRMIRK